MGLEGVRNKRLLYHLTKLANLESIIEYGLVSRKSLIDQGKYFEDIADSEIINKRKDLNLEKYIPFHFHPYSAFDIAVKNTYYEDEFVYLCLNRTFAKENGFNILIKHPLSQEECILYRYEEGFDKIDWETMEKVGERDEYSRNVKMAECLTDRRIRVEDLTCIYVQNEEVKKYIEGLFREAGVSYNPPYVNINETWFKLEDDWV